ncbi:TonB-dependent receptor [Chitinophagaceae bacterium LB-8]|uniref:TonB-dependent receptor n=1 Tax=Paraflavisolibacter caeni TaxID=2982496 RepID=A0A9X2XZP9_9BACT|nr:TonB-dependent receptor [Paraflavisolibacter caeni]MCU7551896.1 TonB-dependent receptor [Paraflavisolibacter caeni]
MIQKLKRSFLCFMLLLGCNCLFAQQKTVSGKIIDQETGQPLTGVTVNVKGSTQNVLTKEDGSFSITIPSNQSVLLVSYVGYGSQELPVGNKSTITLTMTNTNKKLDEVVVIGYGTVRKRDLTGAVVSVKGEEVTKVPATTPMEAIQGKIPGADIYRDNGYAGQGANVRIRGTRSIGNPGSSNNVLYIVDGVQGVNMADINPNDIQSIEVLKDASSTAIYGSRGANGVVIITTKRGTTGKAKLSFNTYSGISKVAGYGEFQNGPEYVAFKREAFRAAGTWNSPADDSKIFNAAQLAAIQNEQYVDWQDLLQNKGAQQDYQIGVAGGTDKTKVYFSAGYFHEKGILKLDEYKRYTGRFNIDQTINNWMKVGINSQLAYIDNDIRRDPFNQASKTPPIGSAYDSAGNFILYPNGGSEINPLADQQPGQWDRNTKTTRFSAATYLELTPIKDLSIKSTFSTTQSSAAAGWFYGKNTIDGKGANSQSQITNSQSSFISWENLLNYKKQIGDHSITLTGVTSYLQTINTSSFAGGKNQIFESQSFYNIGSASQQPFWGSGYNKQNLVSFTGRANYSYLGKYLLTLTGRSDGSSKLGTGNKWAFFPSAALGWRIVDEGFMDNQDLFSDLKLRASYGISGNDVISPYATQNSLTLIPFSYNDANAAVAYGINTTIGNDALEWELTATKDLGLDFSILKNRISGNIDYYDALTSNLIFPYTLPGSTGVSTINRNVGKTRNRGIEVGITTHNITNKAFTWSSNVTFTKNKEKIVELPNGDVIDNDYRKSLILGQSPTIYYDYKKIGIWQLGEEAEAAKYNAIPGDIKIADISGPDGKPDGAITSADRTYIGTRVPKWTGGLNNDFKYKGFDLNVFIFARVGQWMSSDYYAKFVRNGSQNSARVDYWTPENPTNAYPRPHATRSSSYVTTLTEFENSYVKLRNVTLGYTLPKDISSRFKMDNLRVYVSGKNLGWISNKKDFDPESEGIIDQPLSKLFVAGLNVTF